MMKLLDISTEHLSRRAVELLDTPAPDSDRGVFEDPNSAHRWLSTGGDRLVCYPTEYGWLVYAHDDFPNDGVPEELDNIFRYARERHCDYIMFDRDAETVDDLPLFEEDWADA